MNNNNNVENEFNVPIALSAIIIIIMMKNFNRRSFHGHHGSKRRELAQHAHTHVDRTHSLTQLHQHSYIHVERSASSAITYFGIDFII